MGKIKTEEEDIKYPVFVDDMVAIGRKEKIEEMNDKMKILEITKKYKFNTIKGKSEWMLIKNERKTEEEVELEVRDGKIGRTNEYKYLGDVYNHKGSNESKIKAK